MDVRTARVPMVNSELVAPGLSMIGAEAGVRYLDRVPAYLNNLYRLGLIWFSREALPDPLRYQVLEAQPEVGEALDEAGRGGQDRAPQHPPDAVRRGLLPGVPAPDARRRTSTAARQRGRVASEPERR